MAVYKIGWFGRGEKNYRNKVDCRTIPLQQLTCETLGLEYKEIRPKITFDKRAPLVNNSNYVAISTDSTAQAKYWNRNGAWQQLVNWLNDRGYTVVNMSKQRNNLKNVIDKTGVAPLENLVNIIQHAKFYIGLSSGLAWMSWALNKKVVMIAGFTAKWFEFQDNNYRVRNDSVCNSCFTDTKYWFNRGDWMWCPAHKGTPQHFICHKSITPEMVEDKIIQLEQDLEKEKI
jgi:autotransporter strand-loop-strand O-heptosyltransferase